MAEERAGSSAPGSAPVDQGPLLADPTDTASEGYYSDADSDLTSLASSVTNYVYENGRRYHAYRAGKYVLPNDDTEKDRLDLVHHLFTLVLRGALHLAPIKNPQTVLDMGTGTGIWALDMADLYPAATVIGNDLSPIQPQFIAPNTQFVVEDFEEEWAYPENKFDYIHGRTLLGAVQDWPELFAQAYKHLKPGGYLEMQEGAVWAWSDDGSLEEDSPIMTFLSLLGRESEKIGRPMNVIDKLETWMKEAGFVDVELKVFKVPWSPWPKDPHLKEVGKFQFANMMQSIDSYGLALLTRSAGYSEQEAKIFLAVVRNQIRTKALHCYNKIYCVYGRKP
ncbi:hypothetical protein VTN02DRAFT_3469 [Thermoascus thermophilus]